MTDLRSILKYDPDTGRFHWQRDSLRRKKGDVAGTINKLGYVVINIGGKLYSAHRLAWYFSTGAWPVADIDHRNRDRADNRLANLREATRSQNGCNKTTPPNRSGYRGVTLCARTGRWIATIQIRRKRIWIGRFGTPDEAFSAYCARAKELHGEFVGVKENA